MTATTEAVQAPATGARRNEKVGQVVSTKMQKTIVVEVEMRKPHTKYKKIMRTTKGGRCHAKRRPDCRWRAGTPDDSESPPDARDDSQTRANRAHVEKRLRTACEPGRSGRDDAGVLVDSRGWP